jgi:FAD/FMN-containing dehydrogenase
VEWRRLRERVRGELVPPGDDAVRAKPFVARDAEPVPAAILRVASAQDAAAAVSFVREHDLAMAVRCGGHCSVGTSSTTGLLIDMSGLATVTVDGTRATVGGGTLLGPLVERLARHGRALPAGTCPTVGVGGLGSSTPGSAGRSTPRR